MAKEIKLTLTDKKNRLVHVKSPAFRYGQRIIEGRYSKDGKTLRMLESTDVSINYSSIKDVIKTLQETTKNLKDAEFRIESYDDYGSQTIECTVVGWRDATEDEVKQAETYLLKQKKERIEAKRKAEAKEVQKAEEILRKQRPELFKEN